MANNNNKASRDQKTTTMMGLLSTLTRSSPTTTADDGRLLVTPELVQCLDVIFRKQHRPVLPRAAEVLVKAFIACVARVGGGYAKLLTNGDLEFTVQDEKVFDQIIRLCFQFLGKCLYQLLDPVEKKSGLASKRTTKQTIKQKQKRSKQNTHFKHWHRYGALTKRYLQAVYIFLVELQSNQVIVPAIRAVADLVDLFLHFPKLCKNLIKYLVLIWSQQSSEEARCMAFVVFCKISRLNQEFFPLIFKSCYVAYVANCKRVDDDTLPYINFMQRTFTELTLVHPNIAYQYAFVYIRQFGIHLRTAMAAERKDLVQKVYNWPFLLGLQLWTCVICEGTHRYPAPIINNTTEANDCSKNEQQNWFREMIHPMVENILIMERLFPSTKFLPLRIYCLRMLLNIQTRCDVFVPTLAYSVELLEVLGQIDAKKPQRSKGTNKEGIHLEKMLRLSNEQLDEAGIRMHLAQQIFALANDSLNLLKSSEERSWRHIVTPISVKLKHFLKTCANREHVRLFAQLKVQLGIDNS